MGVFLIMISSLALTYAFWKIELGAIGKNLGTITQKQLGSGSGGNMGNGGSQAKILNKPQVGNSANGNLGTKNNNGGQIPNMRGVDNPNTPVDSPSVNSMDNNSGNSHNIAGDSVLISGENINLTIGANKEEGLEADENEGKRSISRPVMIGDSNIKLKGVGALKQMSTNISNEIDQGQGQMNVLQGEGAKTLVNSGEVNVLATGDSQNYFYGTVEKISQGVEKEDNEKQQINGFTKIGNKKFTVSKEQLQMLTNAQNAMQQNGNQIQLGSGIEPEINGVSSSAMNIYNSNMPKLNIRGMEGLNEVQKIKMLEVFKLEGSNNYREFQKESWVYKEIIKKAPNLSPQQILDIGKKAIAQFNQEQDTREAIASCLAGDQIDEQNMGALDNILLTMGSAKESFDMCVTKEYEERMRAIAEANMSGREGKALEEEELKEEIVRVLKEKILSDPESAKNIIGVDGAKALQEALDMNDERYESTYNEILRDLEQEAYSVEGSTKQEKVMLYMNKELKEIKKKIKADEMEKQKNRIIQSQAEYKSQNVLPQSRGIIQYNTQKNIESA